MCGIIRSDNARTCLAAIGGGVSGGLPANIGGFGNVYAQSAARAVFDNLASQGVGMMAGLQSGFDWRNVAAAGAVAGQAFSGSTILGSSELAQRTISGFAAGTAASIMRGGKIDVARIATDAFGNALGSSLAASVSGDGRTLPRRPVSDSSSITPVDPSGPQVDIPGLLAGLPDIQGPETFFASQAERDEWVRAGQQAGADNARQFGNTMRALSRGVDANVAQSLRNLPASPNIVSGVQENPLAWAGIRTIEKFAPLTTSLPLSRQLIASLYRENSCKL